MSKRACSWCTCPSDALPGAANSLATQPFACRLACETSAVPSSGARAARVQWNHEAGALVCVVPWPLKGVLAEEHDIQHDPAAPHVRLLPVVGAFGGDHLGSCSTPEACESMAPAACVEFALRDQCLLPALLLLPAACRQARSALLCSACCLLPSLASCLPAGAQRTCVAGRADLGLGQRLLVAFAVPKVRDLHQRLGRAVQQRVFQLHTSQVSLQPCTSCRSCMHRPAVSP